MTGTAMPPGATGLVITVSDRSAAGERADTSGPLLAGKLRELGLQVGDVQVVPDEPDRIVAALRAAVTAGVDLAVTTGGTGLTPRDVTPEATRQVLEREAPGIAELIRAINRDAVPASMLSRGVAGTAGRTLIVNLPGSTGGVKDGARALAPILGHAISQLRGSDH